MLQNTFSTWLPRTISTTITTTAIRTRIRAYSTIPWPSSLRVKRSTCRRISSGRCANGIVHALHFAAGYRTVAISWVPASAVAGNTAPTSSRPTRTRPIGTKAKDRSRGRSFAFVGCLGLGGRGRGRRSGDRRSVRRRIDDGRIAAANAEPVAGRKAVEEDCQDHDQGDQENRHHRRIGATVAIVVLVNDCHEIPPWYPDNLIDTATIISITCADVNKCWAPSMRRQGDRALSGNARRHVTP